MTIICDATAFILLAKATVLEILASRNNVITTQIVYEEVVIGKEKGRFDSLLVERLVNEMKIKLQEPDKSSKEKIQKLFNLKLGELDIISLAQNTSHTVLSDDKKCLNVAKALGISFITSLDVIIALYKKKAIRKEKAIESIDTLDEYGWYSRSLIKKYKEAIK